VTRLNRKIPPGAIYSQVHPKMKDDGSYPRDFGIAMTGDQFEAMDCTLSRPPPSPSQYAGWSADGEG